MDNEIKPIPPKKEMTPIDEARKAVFTSLNTAFELTKSGYHFSNEPLISNPSNDPDFFSNMVFSPSGITYLPSEETPILTTVFETPRDSWGRMQTEVYNSKFRGAPTIKGVINNSHQFLIQIQPNLITESIFDESVLANGNAQDSIVIFPDGKILYSKGPLYLYEDIKPNDAIQLTEIFNAINQTLLNKQNQNS
jgi:hypothetical protein